MGFPRIISKNNKIYTKLGEFCLSCDGSNFYIICHTCQEELQTQDQFWKHIQDEHNFLHSLGKETNRLVNACITDNMTDATLLPLPLYRKASDDEPQQPQRISSVGNTEEDSQDHHESKHYTEMRGIDAGGVEIDIKEEPATQSTQAQQHISDTTTPSQTLYQLSQQAVLNTAYSTVVHSMPSMNIPALAPLAPPPSTVMNTASLLSYEMQQQSQQHQQQLKFDQLTNKHENSTTASASSAVSSDDGERWYICEFDSCGLKFKYQSRLELHRSVHSKERRFSCDLCGASFKQSCNLSTHRKKKHFMKGARSIVTHAHMISSTATAQPPSPPPQQQIKFE